MTYFFDLFEPHRNVPKPLIDNAVKNMVRAAMSPAPEAPRGYPTIHGDLLLDRGWVPSRRVYATVPRWGSGGGLAAWWASTPDAPAGEGTEEIP